MSDSNGGTVSTMQPPQWAIEHHRLQRLTHGPVMKQSRRGDDLYCVGVSTDPDGDIVTYTYTWTSDAGATVTGDTVLASETQPQKLGRVVSMQRWFTQFRCWWIHNDCFKLCLTNCDTNLDLGGGQSIDMVLIPSGSDPLGRYDITSDFYLMTTEVIDVYSDVVV